jgi:hypothetical protein
MAKGKRGPSKSDSSYQLRRKNGLAAANKDKRIKRHEKRMSKK